jgi:hypothetical protein
MFSKLDLVRWIGPSVVAVTVITLYLIFVSPTIKDMMDDWTFLHLARQQAIIQSQQNANK